MGIIEDWWEGLGNLARDPVRESQIFIDEKWANLGDVSRGTGNLVSDLTTALFGGVLGTQGVEQAEKGGVLGGIIGGGTAATIGAGISGLFGSLGLDAAWIVPIVIVVGLFALFMVLK